MPRRPFSAPAVLILSLTLVIAACGGSGTSSSEPGTATPEPTAATPVESAAAEPTEVAVQPGTTLDACAIVTPEDVAAALAVGGPVGDGTLEASPTNLSPGRTTCTYEGDYGRLLVELTPDDGANLYGAAEGAYDDADAIPVGDGAFFSPNTKRAFVWQGNVAVMLSLHPMGPAPTIEMATDLATRIIDKL